MNILKSLLVLTFLSFGTFSWCQEPVLVTDYNDGTESAFDNFNSRSHQIGDDFLIPLFNPDHGVELGILKDGELSLLMDINPGEESSEPKNFISYKGLVYFSCEVKEREHRIWVTDGTAEGTVQIYDIDDHSSLDIRFFEAESGWLYFGYSAEIHRTDGTDFQVVAPLFLGGFSNTVTRNIAPYKGEIAIIDEESSVVSIYAVNSDSSIDTLFQMDVNFITDIESFIALGDYLLFELDDFQDDDLSGYYHWREGAAEATKIDVPRPPSRLLKLSDESMVGTLFQTGVFSFQADDSGIIVNQEFDGWPETFSQGAQMRSIINKGKALYEGVDDFPNDMMFVTDVNTLETTTAIELQSLRSNIIGHNNFAFLASGVSNGFEPIIHYYDFKENEDGVIKAFVERSNMSSSIIMVGVQEGKLYFLCNLYPDTGREMYYLDISDLEGLEVSVDNTSATTHEMRFYDNGFEVVYESPSTFDYAIYNINAELISQAKGTTNQFHELSELEGMILVKILIEGKEYTYPTTIIRP